MGKYTEINVCFDLVEDAPENVIDILSYLIGEREEEPYTLPEHSFFVCDRWREIAKRSSYSFGGLTHSEMSYDGIDKCFKVNIRACVKNYSNEIDKFIDWLAPYIEVDDYGFIGYKRPEDNEVPTLIRIRKDGKSEKRVALTRLEGDECNYFHRGTYSTDDSDIYEQDDLF